MGRRLSAIFFHATRSRYFKTLRPAYIKKADAGEGPQAIVDNVRAWGGLGFPWLSDFGCTINLAEMIERRAKPIIGPCHLVPKISLFRRFEHWCAVDWHIDADGADTKAHDPCFNVWTPLASVGCDRPSLELIRGSHQAMRREPVLSPTAPPRSSEWIVAKFGDLNRETPQLEPGDALITTSCTAHSYCRTRKAASAANFV